MLSDIKGLDSYFQAYGELLGVRATKALTPLHVPGKDPEVPGMELINQHVVRTRASTLLGGQRDLISGAVKALRRQKAAILACKMGTGKSLMGSATCHLHAGGGTRPYR